MEDGEFKKWLTQQKGNILFFDGASRRNPGAVGAGG
jgi:prepilin-type processing-associated H-X9-DG protein